MLKLKQKRVSKNLLKIFTDFPTNRYQKVILNEQASGWAAMNVEVHQASILGFLLFLVYVSDLSTRYNQILDFYRCHLSFFACLCWNTLANYLTLSHLASAKWIPGTKRLNNGLLKINNWEYQ